MLQLSSETHQSHSTNNEASPAFVDKAGLALLLGRTPRYVEHLVERHLIPFIRIPARKPGIIKGDINGKIYERAKRGGQLFFCPRKVINALESFEVKAETTLNYKTRSQRTFVGGSK
ncbi:hypothetical protein MCEMIH22_01310 [Candidatus Methylacidiphilaceae bacterium]